MRKIKDTTYKVGETFYIASEVFSEDDVFEIEKHIVVSKETMYEDIYKDENWDLYWDYQVKRTEKEALEIFIEEKQEDIELEERWIRVSKNAIKEANRLLTNIKQWEN